MWKATASSAVSHAIVDRLFVGGGRLPPVQWIMGFMRDPAATNADYEGRESYTGGCISPSDASSPICGEGVVRLTSVDMPTSAKAECDRRFCEE